MDVHLEDSSQWKVWFGRVGSHSNPSDAPSRMQVEELLRRGVTQDSVAWDVVIMSYEETLHMLGRGWVRVQHPTRPVGLAGWHVRPPLCFEKRVCRPSDFQVNPPWEFFWQCVSNFSAWSTCGFSCVFVRRCFKRNCDVRSEYMSAHVRIDSSGSVGFPFLGLFVVVGLA